MDKVNDAANVILLPEDDAYVRTLISSKVGQLIAVYGYSLSEREDLTQEFLARMIKSLDSFDPAVGHFYPFIRAVIERHFLNIVRDRRAAERNTVKTSSLNVPINPIDIGHTELIQTVTDQHVDRRLGRERSLSEEELSDLRMDLTEVISQLPMAMQQFLERRKTQSLSEISREMGIPRSTLQAWLLEIRRHFEKAGLEKYFSK